MSELSGQSLGMRMLVKVSEQESVWIFWLYPCSLLVMVMDTGLLSVVSLKL